MRVISRMRFVRALCCCSVILSCVALGQSAGTGSAGDKTPVGSIPLATATVSSCIRVEAVLLPRDPAAKLFSGYVAQNYAVVKTTISNSCDNQQFILHDIYFDYSDWALSGVYKKPPAPASCPAQVTGAKTEACTGKGCTDTTQPKTGPCVDTPAPTSSDDSLTQGTKPGQVATVGALDLQDQVTEDSIFSKRNLVVNGLTLVGQVAGGYAFVGAAAAAKGIGAYNSAFVPNLGKFWPDRRLDQEQFLLKLGYRTDQSTAIAKDDHGSYYAFFPLATFLTPHLKKLFLEDSAVFLNPAEAWIEPGALDNDPNADVKGRHKKDDLEALRGFIWKLAQAIPGDEPKLTPERLFVELSSACSQDSCPICPPEQKACPGHVLAEKTLFAKASLNSVKIVVRGVMTVDLDDIPPIINTVSCDGEKSGASYWTVSDAPEGAGGDKPATDGKAPSPGADPAAKATVKTLSCTATGKYLSNATINATQIDIPNVAKPNINDYLDKSSTKTDSSHSSDTSLAFSIGLIKTLPTGAELTFQASRATPNSATGTSIQVTSSNYVYKVTYDAPPGDPSITNVAMDNDATIAVWQTPAKLGGTITGTNLAGGTVTVSSLKIAKASAKVADYIGAIDTTSSDAGKIEFKLQLLKAVPVGSTVSFVVSTKVAGKVTPSPAKDYTVTAPKATEAKPATKKHAKGK